MFKRLSLKLGNMRKPQEFSGLKQGNTITIQSDKSIGQLNLDTNKFIFTNKGSYFPHLSLYGQPLELTETQKKAIIELCDKPGDKIGGFIIIGGEN